MAPPVIIRGKEKDLLNLNGECRQTEDVADVKDSASPNQKKFRRMEGFEDDSVSSFALSTKSKPFQVSTLVFFDTETTGLAHEVGKENVQITEISMIAVDRSDFYKSAYLDLRDIRIVHKLSLCIRPTCPVSDVAAKLSGLSSENLQSQQPFDDNAATAVVSFLSRLRKPVVLLAHNGNRFDFPLLKAEFQKLKKPLPSDCYRVDTLVGLRSIGIPDPPKALHKDVKFQKNGNVSLSLSNLYLYFFGKMPLTCHSSEGDCIALAKVCHMVRERLMSWIDKHCTNFDAVQPAW